MRAGVIISISYMQCNPKSIDFAMPRTVGGGGGSQNLDMGDRDVSVSELNLL